MKRVKIVLLFIPLLLLWGCPYESTVPVDEPKITIDQEMFGKWRHVDEEKSYTSVNKYGENEYRMVYNSWTEEHSSYQVKMLTSHLSVLSGITFLNIRPDMKTGGSYFITSFMVNASKDTVTLMPISGDHKKKFTNSVELREWILKKMRKKNFFDKAEIFVRVP